MPEQKKPVNRESDNMPSLRERAERRLRAVRHEHVDKLSQEEVRKLVHELETHQIELEMQNLELQEAHRNLEQSRAKYVFLYNRAPVGYMTFNNAFNVQEANFTAAKMLGRNLQELYRTPFLTLVAKADRGLFLEHMNRMLHINHHYPHHQQELRVIRKDRSELYVSLESERSEEDDQILIRTAVVDITERKRAEESLVDAQRQAEEDKRRFEAILETAPVGVVVIESSTRKFSFVNKRAAEIYGMDYAGFDLSAQQARLQAFRPDNTPYRHEDMPVSRALKGEKFSNVEMSILRPDGERLSLMVSGTPLLNDAGRVTAAVIAFKDITSLKQAEMELKQTNTQLAEANKELDAFVYSVSHDLRAPLRAITNFSELLISRHSEKLDDKGKSYVNRVVEGGVKMERIIEDLLRLSRVSRQQLNRVDVDLSKIVKAGIDELRINQHGRRVIVDVAESLAAHADPQLVVLALSNLLNNAWKYTSKKDEARIEFGSFERDKETIYYVKDNGAGFDQKFADRLFQPFQRLHSEQEFEGSGIGLAIVERVIRRHGGRIWAESMPNEGAAFYFTLS